MAYSIRTLVPGGKCWQELTVDALAQALPQATIAAVLRETGVSSQRERKPTLPLVVWALLALNLYTALAMGPVLKKDRKSVV